MRKFLLTFLWQICKRSQSSLKGNRTQWRWTTLSDSLKSTVLNQTHWYVFYFCVSMSDICNAHHNSQCFLHKFQRKCFSKKTKIKENSYFVCTLFCHVLQEVLTKEVCRSVVWLFCYCHRCAVIGYEAKNPMFLFQSSRFGFRKKIIKITCKRVFVTKWRF